MQQKENNSRKKVAGKKYGVEVEEWKNDPSLELPSVAAHSKWGRYSFILGRRQLAISTNAFTGEVTGQHSLKWIQKCFLLSGNRHNYPTHPKDFRLKKSKWAHIFFTFLLANNQIWQGTKLSTLRLTSWEGQHNLGWESKIWSSL